MYELDWSSLFFCKAWLKISIVVGWKSFLLIIIIVINLFGRKGHKYKYKFSEVTDVDLIKREKNNVYKLRIKHCKSEIISAYKLYKNYIENIYINKKRTACD